MRRRSRRKLILAAIIAAVTIALLSLDVRGAWA